MSQPMNRYKANMRDALFVIFEQFGLEDLLGKPPFEDWGKDTVEMVLREVYKWSCDVIGPLNAVGDRQGCTFEAGTVTTPPGFKKAWDSLYEAGWRGLSHSPDHGGQGGPFTVQALADEFMSGANPAFSIYGMLTDGVSEVISTFGTPDQVSRYIEGLHDGRFGGTMCLTEPQAGSDVGLISTRAEAIGDGKYKISGTKVFISAGDHDLSTNIVHLVLARTPDAPAGTRGLSLFLVPRDRLEGGANDVSVGSIEHKMGINASATCVLNFGENGECIGELLGVEEQQGIRQMFRMMNLARIGVGIQGLSVAAAAYECAVDYAKERKQGASVRNWKNAKAPRVPIIEHADVRRMLLDMKSRVEGIRALAIKLAMHTDREQTLRDTDEETANYHKGQVDLLVPLLKSYASDQAFYVCATAMQVFGGAGYVTDHPVEQYCRDAKIFSIYEGTNHIQALDLVGRKLGTKGGSYTQTYLKDVGDFIEKHKAHPSLADEVSVLSTAVDSIRTIAMRFWGWFRGGDVEHVPLSANCFLEMMAETTVGWLLLDAAIIAEKALEGLDESNKDWAFYTGKISAARYFANNVLPHVASKAQVIDRKDRSALDIPVASFTS